MTEELRVRPSQMRSLEDYGVGAGVDTAMRHELDRVGGEVNTILGDGVIEQIVDLNSESAPPGEKDLTSIQALVAICVAHGAPSSVISRETGITAHTISNWRQNNSAFRTRVSEIQSILGTKSLANRFDAIAERAIEVAEEIMEDGDVTPSTRLQAAVHFIEQTRGKPTQKVEHKDNLLQSLLSRIDADSEKAAVERFIEHARRNDDIAGGGNDHTPSEGDPGAN